MGFAAFINLFRRITEEAMTEAVTARDTVRAYYESWTRGDMAKARSHLADNLDFQGPIDRFGSADAFVAALTGFAGMLIRTELIQEFYADNEAALLYDCVTASPAGTLRTAEFFRLEGARIVQIRLVFDASELRKLMAR
ncbi:MAG: nuclear transport factor 2 family protein [Sulfuritalea sp.]|nr:nuclear transport factor 2 family protein [Sulfuritalea sp.]